MKYNLLELYRDVLSVKYKTIAKTGASFCYETRGNILYVFFEHSNGITDWKNNFDFPAKAYREMENRWYVHRGFLRVWKSARDCLKEQIFNPVFKGIVIVGYSHGAALALLCHEYCVYNRPDIADNIYGYGFGCPRVVHGCLHRNICERFRNFFVIRNCRDIVTRVPPVLFGFRHVGNIIHIGRGAKYGPVNSHRPESYLHQLEIMECTKEQPLIKSLPCKQCN